MNFHSLLLVLGLATIAGTLTSLRREHIRTEFSVSWLAVGAVITGLALFPSTFDRVARSVGLDAPVCFLMLGGLLISSLVFEMSHLVSKLRDENVLLAQRVAILEFQIRQAEAKDGDEGT